LWFAVFWCGGRLGTPHLPPGSADVQILGERRIAGGSR
jgi:hypothetical protein